MRLNRTQIVLGLISAIAAVAVALIQFGTRSGHDTPEVAAPVVVSGVVVSRVTNAGVARALISVVGRTESATTEESGAFRLVVHESTSVDALRLRISAPGFQVLDQSVRAPVGDLVLMLTPDSPP
jgi:hypothetical protein